MPASLEPYPRETAIIPGAAGRARRARASTSTTSSVEGDVVTLVATSRHARSTRASTRYLDRSDLFANARASPRRARTAGASSSRPTCSASTSSFGTDANGRDLLARMLIVGPHLARRSALLATGVALLIGVLYGATAGFLGGRVDNVMMRVVDVLYSLPFIFFVILLVVFFGRNFVLMFIAVGAVEWLDMARIVRGQTLSLRRQEFVQAAEALGVGPAASSRRHIIPNIARAGHHLHDAAGAAR